VVTVNPGLTLTTSPPISICAGTNTSLTVSGATNYLWSPSTSLSSSTDSIVTANPTVTTNYSVTGTNSLGCSGTASVVVTVNTKPILVTNNPLSVCPGTIATLSVSGAALYSWSPSTGLNSVTDSIVSASPLFTTTYTVIGTNSVGCSDTTSVIENVLPVPSLNIISSVPAICASASAMLTATGAVSYTWIPSLGLSSSTDSIVIATPTTTTIYNVVGVNSAGCIDSSSISVIVNQNPVLNVTPVTPTVCAGSSTTLSVTGSHSYVWTPGTGLSSTTDSVITATPTSTTTYSVTGTNSTGCSSSTTATVTVSPNLVLNVTPSSPSICAGTSTIMAVTGGTTYVWTPITGLSSSTDSIITATPTTSTTYTVTGTNSLGCNGTATAVVNVNSVVDLSVTPTAPSICPGNNTILTVTGANSYIWTPSTGLSSSTDSIVTAAPTITTTYTVNGTSASGCNGSATVIVTVDPKPNISVEPKAPAICQGTSVTVMVTGASNYEWSPSAGCSSTTDSTVIINTFGCTDTSAVPVTVNSNPLLDISPLMPALCNGNSVTMTATGATTYSWIPAAGLNSTTDSIVIATPTTTTTYSVTGTNSLGCIATDSVSILVNPLPTISYTPTAPIICSGASALLTASGANTYLWSPSSGLNTTIGDSVTANPTATASYLITATDTNGCNGTANVTITVNPLPVLIATPQSPAICSGSNTIMTITGAQTYTWSPITGINSSTDSIITASPATTTIYSVTGTTSSGCSATITDTVKVLQAAVLSITPSSPSICQGSSTLLSVSGGTNYLWAPTIGLSSSTDSIVTAGPTITTNYNVTSTDKNGCFENTSVTVTVNLLPIISVIPVLPSICMGDSTTLTATGANAYTWSPSNGINSTVDSTVNAKPTVTTTYTIIGTNTLGCEDSTQIQVAVKPLPLLTITPSEPAICSGSSTILKSNGANSYVWTPSTGLSSTIDSIVTANPTINSTYQVTGLSSNGCSAIATVTVVVNNNPIISVTGPPSVCSGQSAILTANGALNYLWSPSASLDTTNGSIVIANPTTNATYHILGTDTNGCKDSTTATLIVDTIPIVSLQPINPYYCISSSQVELIGIPPPPGGTYSGDGMNGNIFTPSSAGVGGPYALTYTYTDGNGCTNSTSISVAVAADPLITVTPDKPVLCTGIATELTASGANNYFWSPPDGLSDTTSSSVTADPTITTTYMIMGVSDSGCAGVSTIVVTVDSLPRASFVALVPNICTPEQLQFINNSNGNLNYLWDFGDGNSAVNANPVHTYNKPGIYKVILVVTNANGCDDTVSNEDTIVAHEEPLMMADAFTPNGDGKNDYIIPNIKCNNLSNYVFRVYNRWGQLLFQTYDPSQGWDGKYNGQPEPVDVYDYYIEFNCGDCTIFKKGNITLLK